MRTDEGGSRSAASGWRWPKIILLGGGAVLLGWTVVKTSVAVALARANPVAAYPITPDDPRVRLSLAMRQFAAAKLRPEVGTLRLAEAALPRSPLAEEPFLLFGAQAKYAGTPDKAQLLLEEARRRNPRSRPTRLLLLDHYLRTNQLAEAADEIAVIVRIVPEAHSALIPALAMLANDPATVDALQRTLARDEELRRAVLQQLAAGDTKPEVVLRLAGPAAQKNGDPDDALWQSKLLERMIARGEADQARALWRQFAGVPASAGGIYDPRFQRLPGPPPFNWAFSSSGAGAAEPTKSSTLEAQYYGRLDGILARQLLALEPGRYQLSFRASGDSPQEGSGLAWTITCADAKQPIADISIGHITYAGRSIVGGFTVPNSGCAAQWLELKGRAREFPVSETVSVSDMRLSKVSDR